MLHKVYTHNEEKLSNNFVSIAFNKEDDTYHILWNSCFRTPLNQTYRISNDYDFGAIDVKDCLVMLYNNPSKTLPGILKI